jgi:hypothetical protein
VREDYSPGGCAWDYFSHDHARSRSYRWGEDGIAGISDNHQVLCFALALWNGRDPILKERIFGLTGSEGNHGEDVKEYYFYLDNTPSHSYMKYLYKYPQAEFPYQALVEENRKRGRGTLEYELMDTGVFEGDRYFDVFVAYAKAEAEDILIEISAINRGPEAATLHLLPTLWYRNTWAWKEKAKRPSLWAGESVRGSTVIEAEHPRMGRHRLYCDGKPEILFTENETNTERLYGMRNSSPYVKDGINRYVVNAEKGAVNPNRKGTKASAHYTLRVEAGKTAVIKLRLAPAEPVVDPFGRFDTLFQEREQDAEEFYDALAPQGLSEDLRNVQRQALAGMLWSKQFYHYVVEDWLRGDAGQLPPPPERKRGRNNDWLHLYNDDVLSMPDKWEYPWFACWDLAFHCIPLAMVDIEFAKRQLMLLTREWYMHPNGQLPAYEWSFSDVNPPVHAWAAWRVYKIDGKLTGKHDRVFLERVFQKLLLNFTWWVNRKDAQGRNIFQGGFLGLDNISVFDRSSPLPTGGYLDQSDGTSWMGMYCLNMLTIALELAQYNPSYEDIASKFFEHFLYIAKAMSHVGDRNISLWDEEDGFFYDVLNLPNGWHFPLKLRSMVGLIPLYAVMTLEPDLMVKLKGFRKRMEWFIENRPDLCKNVASMRTTGMGERSLLSIVSPDRLRRVLEKMLDEREFLGPYGIRSVSRVHKDKPYTLQVDGSVHRVDYDPAESSIGLFGGNSNWRGPVWFPVNFLIIESLQKFHYYVGNDFKVECPTGSGKMCTLWEVAAEISERLIRIFQRNAKGERPVYGGSTKFQKDPQWKDLVLFYEYFHGDSGAGIGASHQTGWTGVVAKLIQQYGEYAAKKKAPVLVKEETAGKVLEKV